MGITISETQPMTRLESINYIIPPEETILYSPTVYRSRDLNGLGQLHHDIASAYGITKPYFLYSQEHPETTPLLQQEVEGIPNVHLMVAPLTMLPTDWVAAIIQDQTRVYRDEHTMGECFPRDDVEADSLLLASMMDGFAPDDLIAFYYYQEPEAQTFKPLFSGRVVHGKTNMSLKQANGNPQASLPTLAALKIKPENMANFGSVKEEDVVCVTRFFRQPDYIFDHLGVDKAYIRSWFGELIARFADAYVGFAQQNERNIPGLTIFDTHLAGIINFTQAKLGAVILGNNGDIEPTDDIMKTILGHHYGYYTSEGNHRIQVAIIPTESYMKGTDQLLAGKPRICR